MGTELTFLGTGAAQGVPPVFARDLETKPSEKDIRTRSSLRIGREHQIDAGPDVFLQLAREHMSWFDLEHLIITHTHSDHFYFDGILQKSNAENNNGKPLNVHMSDPALDWFLKSWFYLGNLRAPTAEEITKTRTGLESWYRFHTIRQFEPHEIGALTVWPVPGTHHGRIESDPAMNLIVELSTGYRFLYGLDTGYYTDEVFEFLGGMKLDMVVLDCTFGGRSDRPEFPYGHLDCASLIRVLERLDRSGAITTATPVYASHINPDQGLDHEGLEAWFAQSAYSVHTAWDGLKIS